MYIFPEQVFFYFNTFTYFGRFIGLSRDCQRKTYIRGKSSFEFSAYFFVRFHILQKLI